MICSEMPILLSYILLRYDWRRGLGPAGPGYAYGTLVSDFKFFRCDKLMVKFFVI